MELLTIFIDVFVLEYLFSVLMQLAIKTWNKIKLQKQEGDEVDS